MGAGNVLRLHSLFWIFAVMIDCTKDEYENPEESEPVYFLDTVVEEVIDYCGIDTVQKKIDEMKKARGL